MCIRDSPDVVRIELVQRAQTAEVGAVDTPLRIVLVRTHGPAEDTRVEVLGGLGVPGGELGPAERTRRVEHRGTGEGPALPQREDRAFRVGQDGEAAQVEHVHRAHQPPPARLGDRRGQRVDVPRRERYGPGGRLPGGVERGQRGDRGAPQVHGGVAARLFPRVGLGAPAEDLAVVHLGGVHVRGAQLHPAGRAGGGLSDLHGVFRSSAPSRGRAVPRSRPRTAGRHPYAADRATDATGPQPERGRR